MNECLDGQTDGRTDGRTAGPVAIGALVFSLNLVGIKRLRMSLGGIDRRSVNKYW